MNDRADLALTLPLDGIQWIQASAGTGKTYALAGVFVRLIVERRLLVREILVVTYTRAAADELRARLRERLNLCAEIAEHDPALRENDSAETMFCRDLVARAVNSDETRPQIARRLRIAALSLDEGQISTVHAFCQRALREHAWTGGIAPPDGDIVENEMKSYEAIARDLWRERAVAHDPVAWKGLMAVAPKVEIFEKLLWQLRDERTILEPVAAESESTLRASIADLDEVCAIFAKRWCKEAKEAFEILRAHRDAKNFNGTRMPAKSLAKDCETLIAEARVGNPSRLLLAKYTTSTLADKWTGKTTSFQAPPLLTAIDGYLSVATRRDAMLRSLGLLMLRASADHARFRNGRNKAARHLSSYDDLIHRLQELVASSPTATQALAEQFPATLLDEGQDSDARQFEIFFEIYRDRGVLYLIGDPKQAIYRFRGGDVDAYLQAHLRANDTHSLVQNFRSTPALIAAFEHLYRRNPAMNAFGDSRIRFETVSAAGSARDDDLLIDDVAPIPLQFWRTSLAPAEVKNKERGTERLAAGCAQRIYELLSMAQTDRALLRRKDGETAQHGPLRPEDLAVLVATNAQSATMQRALAARGVPSVVVMRASVYKSDEALELLTVLRALAGFDEPHLRGALSTRLLGGTLSTLAESVRDAAAWKSHVAVFSQWRERWRKHGVLALIEQLAEQRAAALLSTAGGERRMTNLLHLADLLQRSSAMLDGERAMIDWLAQRIANADDEREDEQLRLESDAGRVHITTLHKSKGLEYPIVFLPFAPLRRDDDRSQAFYVFNRDEKRIVHVCGDSIADLAAQAAQAEAERGEQLRLLYVGLTRARVACFVGCGAIGKDGSLPPLPQLIGATSDEDIDECMRALAEMSKGTIAIADLPECGTERLRSVAANPVLDVRRATRIVRERRSTYSYSRLSAAPRGEEPGVDEAATSLTIATSSSLPSALQGARFGTAFHEIMEHAHREAWRATSASTNEVERIERVLRRHALLRDEDRETILRFVVRMVATTLRTPLAFGARICDLTPAQIRPEMPFHFAIDNADTQHWLDLLHAHGYAIARTHFAPDSTSLSGLMTGVLDAVVHYDRRYWVIDYKTNRLGDATEDYSPPRLDVAVCDAEYDLQYLIYLTALHRWLKTRMGANYDYACDIGGSLYLFVRGLDAQGNGVHFDKPPFELIEAMDTLFAAPKVAP